MENLFILRKVANDGTPFGISFSGENAEADCENAYYELIDLVEKKNMASDYRYVSIIDFATKVIRMAVFRDNLVFSFSYADFVAFTDDKCEGENIGYKGVVFRLDKMDWRNGKCVLKVCTGYWNAGDKISANIADIDLADNVFHVNPDTFDMVTLHNPPFNTRVNKKNVFVDDKGHLMFDTSVLMQKQFDYACKDSK